MKRRKVELVQIEVEGILTTSKECTRCDTVKPLSEFNYKSNGLGKTESRCKQCRREYSQSRKDEKAEYDRKYREKNRDKLVERSNRWHSENREAANKARNQRYYENHEENKRRQREFHNENKDRLNEISRLYYRENIDKVKEYRRKNRCKIIRESREYYNRNKEVFAERWQEYYAENKEEITARRKNHYHENREIYSERWKRYYRTPQGQEASLRSSHRRRERIKGSITSLTSNQWKDAKKHFDYKCAYCISDSELTVDHFVPVSKFGELSKSNVIPACGSCNSSKKDKDFDEWYRRQGFYSEQQEQKILKYLGYKNNMQQLTLL